MISLRMLSSFYRPDDQNRTEKNKQRHQILEECLLLDAGKCAVILDDHRWTCALTLHNMRMAAVESGYIDDFGTVYCINFTENEDHETLPIRHFLKNIICYNVLFSEFLRNHLVNIEQHSLQILWYDSVVGFNGTNGGLYQFSPSEDLEFLLQSDLLDDRFQLFLNLNYSRHNAAKKPLRQFTLSLCRKNIVKNNYNCKINEELTGKYYDTTQMYFIHATFSKIIFLFEYKDIPNI